MFCLPKRIARIVDQRRARIRSVLPPGLSVVGANRLDPGADGLAAVRAGQDALLLGGVRTGRAAGVDDLLPPVRPDAEFDWNEPCPGSSYSRRSGSIAAAVLARRTRPMNPARYPNGSSPLAARAAAMTSS